MPSNMMMQIDKKKTGKVDWSHGFRLLQKALIEKHVKCWKMHDFDFNYHENAV